MNNTEFDQFVAEALAQDFPVGTSPGCTAVGMKKIHTGLNLLPGRDLIQRCFLFPIQGKLSPFYRIMQLVK